MLEDAIAVTVAAAADERMLYWADAPAARHGYAVPPELRVRDQQGADLGARIEHAFEDLIAAPGDRAVIIGTDCPALEIAALDRGPRRRRAARAAGAGSSAARDRAAAAGVSRCAGGAGAAPSSARWEEAGRASPAPSSRAAWHL